MTTVPQTAWRRRPVTFAQGAARAYELTLQGLLMPWPVFLGFTLVTGLALALLGKPLTAAAWAAASLACDLVLQRTYAGWLAGRVTVGSRSLTRLACCSALRSSLWMAAPALALLQSAQPAAWVFAGLTSASLVATAAALGWASRRIWAATAGPAVATPTLLALPHLDAASAAALAASLVGFLATATLIAVATRRIISDAEVAHTAGEAALAAQAAAEKAAGAALDQVARSQARLQVAMEMSGMHVWEMDYQTGELLKAGAEDTFFEEPKTFADLASDIYASVDPRDRPGVKAQWSRHIKAGEAFHPEYRINRRDGREVWTALNMRLVTDDTGAPLRLIGAMSNITARKQAERQLVQAKTEAEQANLAKSQFLANMSHEIRTPMNGVIGMNELLLRTALTPDQRKYAETVRGSADALLGIINDILDLSKLEAGKVELESLDFALERVIQDAVQLLAPKAIEKGLELACHLDPGARGAFRGDPTRLRQVILNLVGNAVKFTPAGHVVVDVRSEPSAGGTRLRVEVRDTGIGLTPEQRARLFQNFQQADSSTTRQYGGTGLGLSISRQLLALMGGEIGVAENSPQGSVFWFELTLRPALSDILRPVPPVDLCGVRVLVVDDLVVNRAIFREQLEAEGAFVTLAESGLAGLAALEAAESAGAPFEVVIMDHQMPGMSGDEAIAAIRARAGGVQPRILMASSTGITPDPDAGQDAYVCKPVGHGALMDALAAMLSDGAAGPDIADADAPLEPGPDAPVAHVLLAEDNETNILLATEILRLAGFSFECARNGREAVEAVAARPFDLVLMDVHMPEMDGLEATRRIRALPRGAGLPIVAMTANAMQGDKEICFEAGMDDFVSKPFRPDEFLGVLARVLEPPSASPTPHRSPGA